MGATPGRALFLAVLTPLLASGRAEEPAHLPLPTPAQAAWQDLELGLFFHFGINTFHGKEWSDGTLPAATFHPRRLDAGQWVRAAREAGARYVVLTAKHHDGFCLWPTATTDYSVRSSPFGDGRGDVVREVAEACAREGLKLGLYLSPWDRHEPTYPDPPAYDRFYARQLEELLRGYGPLVEVWFDGAGSAGRKYDWKEIMAVVRKLAPEAMVFNMGAPTVRWSGNERGFAPQPCWNVVREEEVLRFSEGKGSTDGRGSVWLPVECDVPIRGGWFWKAGSEGTLKSLEELLVIYYRSVGGGANLLLNVAPDDRGLLPESDLERLRELSTEVRRRFGKSLGTTAGRGDLVRLDLEREEDVDHVVLAEDLREGQRIRSYRVEALQGERWEAAAGGRAVGHKRIHWLEPRKTRALRLRVLESEGPPVVRELSAFAALDGEARRLHARAAAGAPGPSPEEALRDLSQAMARVPAFGPFHLARARVQERREDFQAALQDLDRVLSLDEELGPVHHSRADCLFKLGRFRDSVRAYDRSIALGGGHDQRSCWERGLACYYAGDYEAGRRQFEAYHTVDESDIENGLWRWLCMVRAAGLAKAVEALDPYPRRRGPPFPALLELYAGKGSAQAVLEEAERGARSEEERSPRLFHAHYYVGKYLEALGRPEEALLHVEEALKRPLPYFMGHCARIDRERLRPAAALPAALEVRFASVEEGRKALAARDDFIASLSPFDRSARLKRSGPVSEDELLAFLQQQVLAFEAQEVSRLQGLFDSISRKAAGLRLDLPRPVLCVKTTGEEEARSAYTRGSAVVLPRGLLGLGQDELERLLTHELFHVLTRQKPALRRSLYKVLGFETAGPFELPEPYRSRKITNPDAPRIDCVIELPVEGTLTALTPVLLSTEERYDPARGGEFFHYLSLRLLVLERREGALRPELREGKPVLLDPEAVPGYRRQVGRNTSTIIHPEEALADNFVHLVHGKKDLEAPEVPQEMRKLLAR